MLPQTIVAMVNREVKLREQHDTPAVLVVDNCVRDGNRALDGTGSHLRLRDPWYNSGIHSLSDSTWFRWLMVIAVLHYTITVLLK